ILERKYIEQHYDVKPSKKDVLLEARKILDSYINDNSINDLLNHPFFKINFLSCKCKGLLQKEFNPLLLLGLGLAAGMNILNRNLLRLFFERALFCDTTNLPPFASMNQFPLQINGLTQSNFKQALLSSGSVPGVMDGVLDIDGVPGVFRDGGIIDYHLDIPFTEDNESLVLYPHFYEKITPGWFDKKLNRKPCAKNMENVVLIAPSEKFVKSLPYEKIPDRKDFITFKENDLERINYWEKVAKKNIHIGDEFFESIQSGMIKQIVKPLETS
ncbi:hypothetical protein KAJ27_01385, partial [bacterium]|nr:hypothetical protein [bacterium]